MKKILLFLAVFIFLAGLGWGQAATTYTWNGNDGDWDNGANWEDGDSPGIGTSTDIIIIQQSDIDPVFPGSALGTALECATLEIQEGASLYMRTANLDVGTLENYGELIIAGNLTVTTSLINSGNLTLTGESQTVTIPTSLSPVGGTVTYDDLGGSGADFAGLKDFTNLVIKNGTRTGGAIKVGGNFSIAAGSLNNVTSIEVTGTSGIAANITTTGNQTYNGNVTFSGAGTRVLTSSNGDISITQIGDISLCTLSAANNISIEATGAVTQAGTITANSLTVNAGTGITLSGNNVVNAIDLKSNAVNSAQGDITYKNSIASGTLEVTVATLGDVDVTETIGALYVNAITKGVNINLKAKTTIDTEVINVSGVVNLNADGGITVGGNINASQLIAETTGDVNVGAFTIHATSTGKEGTNAAIYINANKFFVDSGTRIFLDGVGGQLCLNLKSHWADSDPRVVNGPEDYPPGTSGARWHQHFVDLTKDLVYGDGAVPPGLNLGEYEYVYNNNNKTSFTLTTPGKKIYIYNARNTPENASGLTFVTNGGSIEFFGTNEFTNITLPPGSGDVKLADTDITVTGNLNFSAGINLTSNSGTGSSVTAANISLNSIATANNKNLTLTSTSGPITVGAVGANGASVGNITVESTGNVTFSGVIFANVITIASSGNVILSGAIDANSIAVTSTTTTIGANIDTALAQTYGAVTLGGTNTTRILTGTTVTLGTITGGGNSLTITGNGVLNNGGTNIGTLTVNGDFNMAGGMLNAASVVANTGTSTIAGNITTTGMQTYGAVTLGGASSLITLQGSNVTLGVVTGGGKSLKITGIGLFNNGGSGINALTVSNDFTLTGGTLSAATVNVTGTSNIATDITTTGDQTYTGEVTLGDDITLDGTTVTMGNITGASHSLIITGNGVLNGGGTTNIGALTVSNNFSLAGGTLNAAQVNVTGTSSIAGNVTTTDGTQTYTGAVTLGGTGPLITLTGSTVTLGTIIGNGKSLTITGDGELHGGSGINALIVSNNFNLAGGALIAAQVNVTGTSSIGTDITTTGNQTYTGAATLSGSKRTITSQGGDILFSNTLSVDNNGNDKIELLATGGNITLNGKTTANQLIAIASGIVNVNAIEIINNTGNEGTSAAIYIEATSFDATAAAANSIIPGESGGQLCLVLKTPWSSNNAVDGLENVRWHQHTIISLTGKYLVYGIDNPPVTIPDPPGYVHVPDTNVQTTFVLDPNLDIYIINASKASSLTFETKGSGNIYIIGTNIFGNITLKTAAGGKIFIKGDVTTTGTQTYLGAVTLDDTAALTGTTVTLGTITGGGKSLTISGNGVLNGGSGIDNLSVTGGTSTINANISSGGTQTYGAVTLGGTVTLTGTTVTLGAVNGGGNSLTISGNGVLNGGSGITNLSVTGGGTSTINANISSTGTQTYGAVTLGGTGTRILQGTIITLGPVNGGGISLTITGNGEFDGDVTAIGGLSVSGTATLGGTGKRTISSSGNIQFHSALTSSNGIELSAANITISGQTSATQLIAKASGTVSVNAININTSTGNEGVNAAIYIEANTFIVTTTALYSIVPGVKGAQWGQLCLKLDSSTRWTDSNGVIDGDEDDLNTSSPHATGYRWHQHIIVAGKILYSFTEDSNGNGRLDRIRVQTNVALNGDFTGFTVSVDGYTVGGTGYVLVSPNDDSFYIYLTEKPELDGGNTPLWSIVRNTSLKDKSAVPALVGNPAVDRNIKPIDTIPPRIAYTLTIPGHNQTYVQMSEQVVSSLGGDNFNVVFGGITNNSMSKVGAAGLGYLFTFAITDSFSVQELRNTTNNIDSTLGKGYFQINNVVDKGTLPAIIDGIQPKYPSNWNYTAYSSGSTLRPPNKLLTANMIKQITQGTTVGPVGTNNEIRRVTDVLVSRTPEKTNSDNYFAWPVWAKLKNASYPAGNGVFWGQQPTDSGIIWQFDGTGFIEKNNIESNGGLELQARMSSLLTADVPVLFWTISNIPAEYRNPREASEARKTGGLWLPNIQDIFYNFVPLSGGITGKSYDTSSSPLYNYEIPASNLVTESGAKFEFVFRLSSASDMFIARIDIPRGGAIPANWYSLLRPFAFEIRSVRKQRGGVTIMNNVINSNNRETTFIRYNLLRPGRVTVQIYTLDGTLVKSLRRNEQRAAGEWTDSWDGTNNGGRAVARGIYFVRVVGPDIDEIRKIMVIK